MTMYDKEFYDQIDEGAYRSAMIVLQELFTYMDGIPEGAIDIGCGTGAWLAAAKNLGVVDVCGIDGEYNTVAPTILGEDFQPYDLTQKFRSSTKFDMAISLEVAEHLPEENAEDFVEGVTSCSDFVLWSAAVPGQGGLNHVNEQWPSYWMPKFARRGFFCDGSFRYKFWDNPNVETWYKQNILLFSKNRTDWTVPVRDLIHPNNYPNYNEVRDEFILKL